MKKLFTFFIIFILFLTTSFFLYSSKTELYNDKLIFQSEHVINDKVDITILNAKSYLNLRQNSYYYIFTDKGRLIVDNKQSPLNSTLFTKIKDNINNTCSASVSSQLLSSDWAINDIYC